MHLHNLAKNGFTALAVSGLLSACGGGGSTAGVGGGTSSDASSTLVLNVSQVAGQAASTTPYQELQGADRMVAMLAQFMLRNAIADIADLMVSVDGDPFVAATVDEGTFMIALAEGTHTIVFSHEEIESEPIVVTVPPDTIVTINNIVIAEDGTITHDPIIVGDGTAIAGQKVLVCHKGKKTLSIGAPAQAAHLAHGDVQGACPSTTVGDSTNGDGTSDDNNSTDDGNGNGNNGIGQGRGRG